MEKVDNRRLQALIGCAEEWRPDGPMMSSVKEQKLQNECILDLATDLRKARAEVERLRSDTGLGWNHRHAELLAATARAEAAEFTVAGLRRALEGLVVRLEEVHNSPEYKSVWCCYMIHGGDYSNGPKYDKVLATAQTALAASPDDHARWIKAEALRELQSDDTFTECTGTREGHEAIQRALAARIAEEEKEARRPATAGGCGGVVGERSS